MTKSNTVGAGLLCLAGFLAACGDDSQPGSQDIDGSSVDAMPTPDAATPAPDAATPAPDAATPAPDAATPAPDAAMAETDAGPDPSPPLASGEYFFAITHDELTREYYLYVPPSYRPGTPMPLLLNFHGGGASAEGHRSFTSRMDEAATANGFIVAYPRGLHTELATGENLPPAGRFDRFWYMDEGPGGAVYNAHPQVENVDDVGFVGAMLDDIESRFAIDTRRVFATGFSNGGVFCHFLACELAHRIAAVASISGPVWADPAACEPARAASVLHVHGTDDLCARYNGGPSGCEAGHVGGGREFISAPATVEIWRLEHNCPVDMEPTVSQVDEGGEIACQTWGPCEAGAEITLCTIEGGDHAWPGSAPYSLPQVVDEDTGRPHRFTTTAVSINDFMWAFFSRHPMPD